MRLLASALFWRIFGSSLLVVAVLGFGLFRSMKSHEELEDQFERLVQHDLKLADGVEVMLRLMVDMETATRGYLLSRDEAQVETFERSHREIIAQIEDVKAVAFTGMEDNLVLEFAHDLEVWVDETALPRIRARRDGAPIPDTHQAAHTLTERMRKTLATLREDALSNARTREADAFEATAFARRTITTSVALAIALALGTGVWIARDVAQAVGALEDQMAATGRLEPLPPIRPRADELGDLATSLGAMAALLREKDGSLRATLIEREAAVENLTQANQQLSDKRHELKEQGRALERASRVKTEFLAAMSHELRTPLSAILGFADLLLQSSKEPLSPRAREALERIRRNGQHLLTLINDVLDLAKAEAGRVDVRPALVDVSHLVLACLAEVDSLRAGKDVRLAMDVAPAIETRTDGQRLRQVLLNLLANAIKFTDAGEVRVMLRADDESIVIAVRDSGIGIPAEAMGELFQDFHQLRVGDGRPYAGTGMGLALSRRLARALGGDIEVSSEPGVGSTFEIRLPRSGIEAPTEAVATGQGMHA